MSDKFISISADDRDNGPVTINGNHHDFFVFEALGDFANVSDVYTFPTILVSI